MELIEERLIILISMTPFLCFLPSFFPPLVAPSLYWVQLILLLTIIFNISEYQKVLHCSPEQLCFLYSQTRNTRPKSSDNLSLTNTWFKSFFLFPKLAKTKIHQWQMKLVGPLSLVNVGFYCNCMLLIQWQNNDQQNFLKMFTVQLSSAITDVKGPTNFI